MKEIWWWGIGVFGLCVVFVLFIVWVFLRLRLAELYLDYYNRTQLSRVPEEHRKMPVASWDWLVLDVEIFRARISSDMNDDLRHLMKMQKVIIGGVYMPLIGFLAFCMLWRFTNELMSAS